LDVRLSNDGQCGPSHHQAASYANPSDNSMVSKARQAGHRKTPPVAITQPTMRKLRYSSRSVFFEPIQKAVDESDQLAKPVSIGLRPRGYDRDVLVRINRADANEFETDWTGKDDSRFSARIRAAATVLARNGIVGLFRIAHKDGSLTIQRV
jgi:hypothetical protein